MTSKTTWRKWVEMPYFQAWAPTRLASKGALGYLWDPTDSALKFNNWHGHFHEVPNKSKHRETQMMVWGCLRLPIDPNLTSQILGQILAQRAGQKTISRLCGGDVIVECYLLDLLLLCLVGARSGLRAPPLGCRPSDTYFRFGIDHPICEMST